LQASIEDVIKEVDAKHYQNLEKVRESHEKQMNELSERLETFEERLYEAKRDRNRYSTELKISLETINQKENKITELKNRISKLQEQVSAQTYLLL
jgi:chromosome segregation ATPase